MTSQFDSLIVECIGDNVERIVGFVETFSYNCTDSINY